MAYRLTSGTSKPDSSALRNAQVMGSNPISGSK